MIITISGPPGSGKDSVAEELISLLSANSFKFNIESMGNLRREAGKNKGMTIEEFNDWSSNNPIEGDKYFDDFQKQYGKYHDNFIMVSRLGWYFIPHSFKVYITVNEFEGARRIYLQKQTSQARNEKHANDINEQVKFNLERMNSDMNRYLSLYNINPYDIKHYNLVIDSTSMTIHQVAVKILAECLKILK